jgi:hypothetical protein
MTTYFNPGDRVTHHSHDSEECERGTVVYDDPTGWVFVDYGEGRVMTSRRQNLTRAEEQTPEYVAARRALRNQTTTEHEETES